MRITASTAYGLGDKGFVRECVRACLRACSFQVSILALLNLKPYKPHIALYNPFYSG